MRKLLYRYPVIIVITLITMYFIFSLRTSLKKADIPKENLQNIASEVDTINDKVQEQEQQLQEAKQPLAKEKIARNELLMKNEGEVVLNLPDIELIEVESEPTPTSAPIKQWQKLILK